jgi:hypothetical protein
MDGTYSSPEIIYGTTDNPDSQWYNTLSYSGERDKQPVLQHSNANITSIMTTSILPIQKQTESTNTSDNLTSPSDHTTSSKKFPHCENLHSLKRDLFLDERNQRRTNTTQTIEKDIEPAVPVTDRKLNIKHNENETTCLSNQNTIIVDITYHPFRDVFDLLEPKVVTMEKYKQKYSTNTCPGCHSLDCTHKYDIMVTRDILIPEHYANRIYDTPNDISTNYVRRKTFSDVYRRHMTDTHGDNRPSCNPECLVKILNKLFPRT